MWRTRVSPDGPLFAVLVAFSVVSCGGRSYESLAPRGSGSATGFGTGGAAESGGKASRGGATSSGGKSSTGGTTSFGGITSTGGGSNGGSSIGTGGAAGCTLPSVVGDPWVGEAAHQANKLVSCADGSVIAVERGWVYWGSIDGEVAKAPISGGDKVTLVPGLIVLGSFDTVATTIAVDDKVYFATGGVADFSSLQSVPLDGGPVTVLAKGAGELAAAAKSGNVYFTDPVGPRGGGVLAMIPAGGGGKATLFTGDPCGIALDAENVYWLTVSGAVMKMPLAGGSPSTLGSDVPFSECHRPSIATNGTTVYWVNGADVIMQLPLDGGTPATLSSVPSGAQLAVDDSSAYWTDSSSNIGTIAKAPLGGGPAITLAKLAGGAPFSIAVDDTSVYWPDPLASSITKLTPK